MFADADQVSGVIVQRAMHDLAADDLAVAKYRSSRGEYKTRFAGKCARSVRDTENIFWYQ